MVLEIKDLKVYFPSKAGPPIKAVDGVSLSIGEKEVLGLVGESGCGKTTIAKAIVGLVPATFGQIIFEGRNLAGAGSSNRKELSRKIQLVLQDPYLSINPRMRVRDVIAEGIDIHKLAESKEQRRKMVAQLMQIVGVDPKSMGRYPIEFSAGQRQRFAIARALAVNPAFLICDEPVSALDVSIQDQILKLLLELREKMGLTYLFITHDLAVVRMISDKVAVMYLGKIVEYASAQELFKNPLHPYTKTLFSAIPIPDPKKARSRGSIELPGELPSASNIPKGCRFHTRCPIADKGICFSAEPELSGDADHLDHLVSCHFTHKLNGGRFFKRPFFFLRFRLELKSD